MAIEETGNEKGEMRKMANIVPARWRRLICISLFLISPFFFFNSQAQSPTVLSVRDLLPNYGLQPEIVDDTAALMDYLDSQPQDYVALTNLCVSLRTKAQRAVSSLENDYDKHDDMVWLDSVTVLADYSIYEYRLRRLADLAARMSIRYSRLEQQRIEAEREAARQRAIEEARRQQEERDRMADNLRANIELHNRAILNATLGNGITDKTKLKELKDIYYSYLMVYNKYDLTPGHATDDIIMRLDELNSFQNDILENVLGENSLLYQIENFKNVLKMRCESSNNDVYRSYTRVFKRTSVPVSFADVSEYSDYINRLQTVVQVQQRYLQTLELRATIAAGSDAIAARYGKKYRDALNTYRDVLATVNQLPAFTTNAESLLFIHSLEEFIEAQQVYLDDYAALEELSARADSIMSGSQARFRDVAEAYRNIEPMLRVVPAFKDASGAALFDARIEEVRRVQQCYMRVITLRNRIADNDDSLNAARKLSRTLATGYRDLRRAAVLQPQFYSVERGEAFIAQLEGFLETQQLCLNIMDKLRVIDANERTITGKDNTYRNIARAYQTIEKAYNGMTEIVSTDDLRRYNMQCDNTIEMQQAFIKTMHSPTAEDCDKLLRRETDVKKIKLAVGLN